MDDRAVAEPAVAARRRHGAVDSDSADSAAGRAPGYGLTTNILTGGLQCAGGNGGADRVAFYKRYCDVLGVGYGPNLDCFGQAPFDGDIMSASAAK